MPMTCQCRESKASESKSEKRNRAASTCRLGDYQVAAATASRFRTNFHFYSSWRQCPESGLRSDRQFTHERLSRMPRVPEECPDQPACNRIWWPQTARSPLVGRGSVLGNR